MRELIIQNPRKGHIKTPIDEFKAQREIQDNVGFKKFYNETTTTVRNLRWIK